MNEPLYVALKFGNSTFTQNKMLVKRVNEEFMKGTVVDLLYYLADPSEDVLNEDSYNEWEQELANNLEEYIQLAIEDPRCILLQAYSNSSEIINIRQDHEGFNENISNYLDKILHHETYVCENNKAIKYQKISLEIHKHSMCC